MTAHREIKKIIYSLKREWGTPVDIRRETVTLNVDTGNNVITPVLSCSIRRGIILPRAIQTDFVYDLSFIAANKNFTYGGNFEVDNQDLLLDGRDLRDDTNAKFEMHQDDFVYIGTRRYTIQKIRKYDKNGVVSVDPPNVLAYIVTIKDLEANPDV
jgi:hypothetical protein